MSSLDSLKVERLATDKVTRDLQTHGTASMSTEAALTALGLTGSGTIDSLTVDLDTGSQVTITKQDVADFTDAPLQMSLGALVCKIIKTCYAVDLIGLARRYFDLVAEATA